MGRAVSFSSEQARQIKAYKLIELYFRRLRWMYAKQDQHIGIFGRMNAVHRFL